MVSKKEVIMRILAYLLVGLVIGTTSGMFGIGGGVLLVPALVWLFGFDQRTAAGTTLAVLIPPIGLPAAWKYYYERQMDLQAALWIAAAFAVGGYLGAAIVNATSVGMERFLRYGLGLLMIYIGVRFLFAASSEAANAAFGSAAVLLAWTGYLGMRALGRRHLARPDLGGAIRAMHEQGHGDTEYHI